MIDGAMQDFPLTLDRILDHAAKWYPDGEVVTARDHDLARIDYATLRVRALKASRVLSDLGTRAGDRVATLAWNTQEHVEVWYGIMGMGAVCHTLNPRLTVDQLTSMIDQSEARIVIAGADLASLAIRVARQAKLRVEVLVIDGEVPGAGEPSVPVAALAPLLDKAGDDIAWGHFDERAPSGLCFTSGSTGDPKGVTYTHRGCFLQTLRLLQADVFGLTSADAVLPVVPMFHANAWGLPFAVPATGARLVLPGRHLDGASLAKLIRSACVTIAVGVPTVWLGLCEHLDATGETLPSLRRIIVGGASMPPALMARLEQQLGVPIQTTWGMTELSPVGTAAVPADPLREAAVSGRPALGVDLLLLDENGAALLEQRGEEGRLHVRGGAVIERYFGQDPSATNEQGWFDTGDLARIDRHGNLRITGRSKDLIKSGGEWINPAQIEAAICALPQVALAAVIGRSDQKWGERPILLVEMREEQDVSDQDLLACLRQAFASWWLPDEVVRLPAMPLASTGKIDKVQLRRNFGGN